jgi:hypothetical protein
MIQDPWQTNGPFRLALAITIGVWLALAFVSSVLVTGGLVGPGTPLPTPAPGWP